MSQSQETRSLRLVPLCPKTPGTPLKCGENIGVCCSLPDTSENRGITAVSTSMFLYVLMNTCVCPGVLMHVSL